MTGGTYTGKLDGKGIYLLACECGKTIAQDFCTKEEAMERAKQYKARVISQKSTSAEGAFLIEKGGDASVFQQQSTQGKKT